ncbi:MAG TPA: YtxH domain-containing protein [Terriglobales bacterium]|nr:YtxH domain-containing protein [Terriglobales bacterium]
MDIDTKKIMRMVRAVLAGDVDIDIPSRRASSGVPLFLAGLASGVVLGILFAPGAGEETRSQIADRARQGFENAKSKGQEFGRRAQEAAGRGKEQVNEAFGAAKESYSETRKSSVS